MTFAKILTPFSRLSLCQSRNLSLHTIVMFLFSSPPLSADVLCGWSQTAWTHLQASNITAALLSPGLPFNIRCRSNESDLCFRFCISPLVCELHPRKKVAIPKWLWLLHIRVVGIGICANCRVGEWEKSSTFHDDITIGQWEGEDMQPTCNFNQWLS